MHAAVFDVDRTLLPATTSERLFVRWLWRERLLDWRQALAGVGLFLRQAWRSPTPEAASHADLPTGLSALLARWRAERPYLTGLDQSLLAQLARRCFVEEIQPRLARRGLERWQQHRRSGAVTILLSGSLVELIAPLGELLGADLIIGSQLQAVDGRLTASLAGPHPYGPAKAALVRQLANERSLELAQSYCYADHHTDVPMLSLFGHPVCVNPDSHLRLVAQRLGWPVEEFV